MASLIEGIPLTFPLNVLARVIPAKLKQDDTKFSRAAVAITIPLIYFLATVISIATSFREWATTTDTIIHGVITSVVGWSVPVLIFLFGDVQTPVLIFIAQQYFSSFYGMTLFGSEVAFATPIAYLPLIAALILGRKAGMITGFISISTAICGRYGVLPHHLFQASESQEFVWRFARVGTVVNMVISIFTVYSYNWVSSHLHNRVQAAEKMQKQFFSAVCHELRGPCQSILNGTRMLAEGLDLGQDQALLADSISMSGQSLSTLLNDVLGIALHPWDILTSMLVDYEKIGHGSLKLAMASANIRSLVDGVVEMAALNEPPPPEVDIFCDIDDRLPHLLRTDPVRLSQVILSMVQGAIRATSAGSIHINLHLKKRFRGTATLLFEIASTGARASDDVVTSFVATDLLSHQLSPVGVQFSRKALSFAICKRLINLMGGDTGCSKNDDTGSVFWFLLDMAIVKPTSTDRIDFFSAHLRNVSGKQILLATHNQTSENFIGSVLKRWGCRCIFAHQPHDLAQKIKQHPDLDVVVACSEIVGDMVSASAIACARMGYSTPEGPLGSPPASPQQQPSALPSFPGKKRLRLVRLVSSLEDESDDFPDISIGRQPILLSRLCAAISHGVTSPRASIISELGISLLSIADVNTGPKVSPSVRNAGTRRSDTTMELLEHIEQRFFPQQPPPSRNTSGLGSRAESPSGFPPLGPDMDTYAARISEAVDKALSPRNSLTIALDPVVEDKTLDNQHALRSPRGSASSKSVSFSDSDSVMAPVLTSSPPQNYHTPPLSLPVPGGLKVLIVDESISSRTILCMMVKRLGIASLVHKASTGSDALDAFVGYGPFDVVLIDAKLPDMSVRELTTSLRELKMPSHTDDGDHALRPPRIIGAASDFETYHICINKINMDACLMKPIIAEMMDLKLSEVLEALNKERTACVECQSRHLERAETAESG